MSEPADTPSSGEGRNRNLHRERLLRGPDLREAALISFGMALTSINAPRLWEKAASGMAALGNSRRRGRYRRFVERVHIFYGGRVSEADERALWHEMHAALNRRRLVTVAEWAKRPFAPKILVEGDEFVREALRRNRGAILWFDNFLNHQVIGKKGLHGAGLGGWQVSWSSHGFSQSRLGKKYLNPVQIGAEARYVDGRIEFDAASTLAATRRIGRVLAENGIVRITNNAYIGRKFVAAPIGPGAVVSIATTPLNLSLKLGAPILPVAALEEKPLEEYRVAIAPPLDIRDGDAEFAEVAARYGAYLRPLVERYPAQWRGWAGGIRAVSSPAP